MYKLLNRILLFITGTTVIYIINWLFDYVLYPVVMYKYGLINGFIIMILLSFVACIFLFILYDFLKKDFFAIEYSKEKLIVLTSDKEGTKIKRTLVWCFKNSKPLLFVFLSVFDPFIATVYMRKGISEYNGLSKRDWMIFIMSLIIGNGIWAITVFTSLSLFQYVIKIFVHK